MARTRTSDPVRAPALHYAVTERRYHAKPLVYPWPTANDCKARSPRGALAAFALILVTAVRAGAQPVAHDVPCVECQALSALPAQIEPIPAGLQGTRVLVRTSPGAWSADVDRAVERIRRAGGRPGVHIVGVPLESDPPLPARAELFVIDVRGGDPPQTAFDLKHALARARGANPAAKLAVAGPPGVLAELEDRGIAAYLDVLLPEPSPVDRPEDLLAGPGGPLQVRLLPADAASAAAILRDAVRLQSWFPAGLVPVPARSLTCGPDRPLPTFLNSRTLDLVATGTSCSSPALVTSDVPGANVERLGVGDISAFRVRSDSGAGFATGVEVEASRTLTVEEIVARHQAAAARQAAEITTEIAGGSMTLTFEAPGFVAPVTVTSQTTIFTGDGRTDLRQQDIRVNGVRFDADGGVPRLPIIEPERVAAPPLAITLSDRYAYRLDGRESVDGRPAYVVEFTPRLRQGSGGQPGSESLYAGRAWIDEATFGLMRVSAVQTGLKGPITTSEQTDDFAIDPHGRWLLARSEIHQTYEGASVRTPIHRLVVLDRHDVNAPDFAGRRAEAYASRDVMLRDTPDGYRYLKRQPQAQGDELKAGSPQADAGSRQLVTETRITRLTTLAFGVIVDPNITRPLPFAGLSYVDFDLFGTGAQFSGFFGGSYGQLAFSAPSIAGTRWQLAGRAFGIATAYNDRAFELGKEQYDLDITQRPAQAAVWLLRPLSPRASLRIEYDWDYTAFARGELTAPAFTVPRNQNAHAVKLGLDAQRGGWQGSVWGSYAHRIGWRAWGLPGTQAADSRSDFQRYGASVLRSQALSTRVTVRLEAAAMGGSDLDRFSRYSFGTFDNRLHGYPAALIRYDRGAVLRTAVAVAAARAVRVDVFADTAAVHDPGFGRGVRQYTGFGTALEVPAPFKTLLALEWGYGLQGINADGRPGTHVLRLTGYKVF